MNSKSEAPAVWDKEEVILLVVEYFRSKGKTRDEILDGQKMVSKVLRNRYRKLHAEEPSELFRNINGIALQSSRIRCLDPDTPYDGMQPTLLQRTVFAEYKESPSMLISEAYNIIARYFE